MSYHMKNKKSIYKFQLAENIYDQNCPEMSPYPVNKKSNPIRKVNLHIRTLKETTENFLQILTQSKVHQKILDLWEKIISKEKSLEKTDLTGKNIGKCINDKLIVEETHDKVYMKSLQEEITKLKFENSMLIIITTTIITQCIFPFSNLYYA